MTSKPKFTALILVTGVANNGIESKFLEALAPFTITILDKQSMAIRDRYFLAILIELDKAHAKSIEKDLNLVAKELGMDLAIDYAEILQKD